MSVIISCENKQCFSIDRSVIDSFKGSLLYASCNFYEQTNEEIQNLYLEFPEIHIQTLEILMKQNPISVIPKTIGMNRFCKDLDFLNIQLFHPFLERWSHIYFPGEENKQMKVININTRLVLNILSSNSWIFPVKTFSSLLLSCIEIGNAASYGFRNLALFITPTTKLREDELELIESKKEFLNTYILQRYGIRFRISHSNKPRHRDICTSMDITYNDKIAMLYYDFTGFTYKHEQNLLKFHIGNDQNIRLSCQITTLTCLYIVLEKDMMYWTYHTTQNNEKETFYYVSFDMIIVMESGHTYTLEGSILRGVGNTFLTFTEPNYWNHEKIKSATLVLYMIKNPKLMTYPKTPVSTKNIRSIYLSW